MAPRIGPRRPRRLFLQEWRESRGLTQEQLGARLGTSGVSGVTVGRWEAQKGSHRPNTDVLAALAEALDCEPQDFYRPPDVPSVEALLRGQPQDVRDRALAAVINALRKTGT